MAGMDMIRNKRINSTSYSSIKVTKCDAKAKTNLDKESVTDNDVSGQTLL